MVVSVSKRFEDIPASPIRSLVPHAKKAVKSGVRIHYLNIGNPDIKTPKVMLNVLKKWQQNPIGYGESQGEPDFIEALLGYYHKLDFGFIKHNHIQVTMGGSEAIWMTMLAVCSAGDEILTFEPFYTNYNTYAAVSDVKFVALTTVSTNGFHLPERSEIESKITKRTRAILYCSPNNPTGTVYTRDEIEMLVKIARKYNLFLLADEVYREFTYDGSKHVSLLSYMKQIPRQAIVLDSLSKRYSVCGLRLGMLVSLNDEVMAGALRIGQGRLSAGLLDQAVGAALTRVPQAYFDEVHQEYKHRRDVLYAGLKSLPGVVIPKPEGAFYAIVGLPVKDATAFATWLLTDFRLDNETVMLAPAQGFYATPGKGSNEVRIAYVLEIVKLKKAVRIIGKALKQYTEK